MTDYIFINGLLVHAHHGVMAHEEKVGQRFMIDLELAIDLAPAGRSDKLADTASYSAIVETATRAFTRQSFRLVEAAAAQVADAVVGGSAVVNQIAEHGKSKELVKRVAKFVKLIAEAVKTI